MSFASKAKRMTFLVHRWTGVLMCVLMALWFVSGMVMLFVGYPKLTPWERLGGLPVLPSSGCCIGLEAALAQSRAPGEVTSIVLTSIGGRPHYVLSEGDGGRLAVDAVTGVRLVVGPAQALAAARSFMHGVGGEYAGLVIEDRWTHSRSLNPHRQLHVVDMRDAAATRLYVSSATGQVVLDAPRAERLWNFVGAWLHWLYMFRDRPTDPVWSWTVIVLSGIGVVAAFTGALNGIWRWRFAGTYKSGSKSPFRETYLRWHHILGLVFGTVLLTWIFSGLMSMNPLGVFDAKGARPDAGAYEGGSVASVRLPVDVPQVLGMLSAQGFRTGELEWRVLAGEPYILARDSRGDTRLVLAAAGVLTVLERWPEHRLVEAARCLMPAPMTKVEVLGAYDAYYYKRQVQSMYGADERRLPVLRVTFGDPDATWVHLDGYTGQVESSLDRSERAGRWLFNLLHSWDLPAMLAPDRVREGVLLALGLGGILLSVTATVLGLRRMGKWSGKGARQT
ncbi:PepSY domain-containing protein [Massilia sp.]|uniref:PepSY domain-containing protein n=1 Tax=Massilia sp. TaxID=1882437 RepID=UPI0028A6E30F|nr:PepSY domain-containing protein [Massilia sp.]